MSKNSCCFSNAVTEPSLVPICCQTPPQEMASERSIGGVTLEIQRRNPCVSAKCVPTQSRCKDTTLALRSTNKPEKKFQNSSRPPISEAIVSPGKQQAGRLQHCYPRRVNVSPDFEALHRYSVTVQNTLPSTKMANSQTKEISCQCSYSMDVMFFFLL